MKKKLLLGILPLAAASAAVGQVINFQDCYNYPQVPGYGALYYGQGAYADPGHNVWNGFGAPAGAGPGSTLFYGGGNPWNSPSTTLINPGAFVATNNPGNPYAAYGSPPVLTTTSGPTTWGIAGGQINSSGGPTGVPSGNANSDGSYSPITLGLACTALSSDGNNATGVQGTPSWIFGESVIGNGASPLITITLSNVPPKTYTLYLYGAAYNDDGGSLFSVNSGTPHNGINATLNTAADGTPLCTSFIEGHNFVFFQNVVPDANSNITITASPNPLNGVNNNVSEADFNGLQLVTTGPPPGVAIGSSTPAQNVYAGGTANFSVSLSIGVSPSYRWQSVIGGVTNNLSDGPHVTGSGTSSLTLSSVSAGSVGLYQCVVSTAGGTNTSTPAPLTLLVSTAANIAVPGDPTSEYGDALTAPGGFGPANAIDGTLASYINFGGSGTPTTFSGPAGFVVTPAHSGSSIVTGLRFFVPNSHPEDDPISYLLEGSNDGGNTFTTIASGALSLPVERNVGTGPINVTSDVLQEVDFANTTGYTTYRLSAADIRNDAAPTYGLQIGEVQFLGTLTPITPGIFQQPPSAETLFAGATLTASVIPNGPSPYTYQWYFNGTTPVPSATSAALSLPNVQLANAGNYTCVIGNAYGSVTSSIVSLTVVTPNGFQAAVQTYGPVAYWSLEETVGTTAWDYVGEHNGTYIGGVGLGSPGVPYAGFAPTVNSFAVAFDGTTSYVDIPESNLNMTNSVSMMGWILANGTGTFTTFFGHGDPSYRMDYDQGAVPHFAMFNNTGDGDAVAAAPVNDGLWHLIIGVYDSVAQTNYVYVDGTLSGGHGCTSPDPGDAYDVWIGGDPQYGTSRLFPGSVAQAALFNYALSSNQIAAIYNAAGAAPVVSLTTNQFSGNQNGTATIASKPAVGSAPITYQWYQIVVGVTNLVPGATNLTLTLSNVQPAMGGYQYFILASNPHGSGASDSAELIVNSGAPFMNPDLSPAIPAVYGATLVLPVGVNGTLPITEQWYHGSSALSDSSRISGSHSNVLTISGVQASDAGTYQLLATNLDGAGASQIATVTVLSYLTFNGGVGWTLNGVNGNPTFNGTTNVIEMTDNAGGEARSAWFGSPLYVGGFEASWYYQLTSTNNPADGCAFVLQDSPAGLSALGSGGGALGYGGPDGTTTPGITPSVALGMNVYNGHVRGIHVLTNGIGVNSSAGIQYDLTGPVFLTSLDPILFKVKYLGSQMNVMLTDTVSNTVFTTNYTVNVPGVVRTNLALVGFTGGTGGVESSQVISNFTFISLVSLTTKVSGPNLIISWPGDSGYYILQTSTAIQGTPIWTNVPQAPVLVNGQYQVTIPVPPSYTFYRLQLQPL
jgi:Concanavalin A-like lectin/glucanases superfamily/Immunoglobulin domain/Immunoglobulin I-set domain